MATTTNYSWTTPDDTDLVKDGAAAIRTLGSSADTTVKNLNPGTTAGDIDYYTSATAKARVAIGTAGQVLKVNAGGTAPEWGTTADQTPLTTKGDLFTFDTADARLGVGANGTVLTADSAETTGLKWAAPAGAGANWTLLNAGGTALTGAATITVSGISNIEYLQIIISGASSASGSSLISYRFNADSGSNYDMGGPYYSSESTYGTGNLGTYNNISNDKAYFAVLSTNANSTSTGGIFLSGGKSTGNKAFMSTGGATAGGGSGHAAVWIYGVYKGTAAISSVSLISGTGNFDAGTMYVWGA